MNILITLRCNNNCKYCFLPDQNKHLDISMDDIDFLVNLTDFDKIHNIKILGGEPTMHDQFCEIISKIKKNNNSVLTVFTNCKDTEGAFMEMCNQNILIVANINHPDSYSEADWENIIRNLTVIKNREINLIFSYNIYEQEFNYAYLKDLCLNFNVKAVRWSIAMPGYKSNNVYLTRDEMLDIREKLLFFTYDMLNHNILTFNDCPIPQCVISEEENTKIKELYKLPDLVNPIKTGSCNPPLDILPDMHARACMGIGERISFNIKNYSSIRSIQDRYNQLLRYFEKDNQRYCDSCSKCDGGCWGYVK